MCVVCSDTDVHTVASLLKLYLRELPEPVVPWSQYQDFLDCTSNWDSSNAEVTLTVSQMVQRFPFVRASVLWCFIQALQKLEHQIGLLPRSNYNLLSYICR